MVEWSRFSYMLRDLSTNLIYFIRGSFTFVFRVACRIVGLMYRYRLANTGYLLSYICRCCCYKRCNVQFYERQKGDRITAKVKDKVKEICSSERIPLNFINCDTVASLKNGVPVIVLCVNASRLGTDVSAAINGLPDPGNTAVIVLHIKEPHALPSVPSDTLLVGQEYKDLGRIIDIAYSPGTGFYRCDMNTVGLKKIVEFIKLFS